jgi:hypothetical protein
MHRKYQETHCLNAVQSCLNDDTSSHGILYYLIFTVSYEIAFYGTILAFFNHKKLIFLNKRNNLMRDVYNLEMLS